jgi:hypothetical protein
VELWFRLRRNPPPKGRGPATRKLAYQPWKDGWGRLVYQCQKASWSEVRNREKKTVESLSINQYTKNEASHFTRDDAFRFCTYNQSRTMLDTSEAIEAASCYRIQSYVSCASQPQSRASGTPHSRPTSLRLSVVYARKMVWA